MRLKSLTGTLTHVKKRDLIKHLQIDGDKEDIQETLHYLDEACSRWQERALQLPNLFLPRVKPALVDKQQNGSTSLGWVRLQ